MEKQEEQQLKRIIKTEVRKVFQKELRDLVMRDLEIEKGPRKQGDPDVKRIVTERVNVIDFIAMYLPGVEGALRGVQEDTDSAKNTSAKALEAVKAMAEILETTHKSIVAIASFANEIGQLQLPNLETEVVKIIKNAMATKALPFNTHLPDLVIDTEAEEVKDESDS